MLLKTSKPLIIPFPEKNICNFVEIIKKLKEIDFESVTEKEYPGLAEKIMAFAGEETVWLFNGDLGAGKTTLIKYICKALGIQDEIQSPTFSIVNEHHFGKRIVYHFDCYRLESFEEALDFGIEEYLDSGELCLIEWPDRIDPLIPDNNINITLTHVPSGRNINVKRNY